MRRIAQAGARAGSWTGSRSTPTARTRASRRPLPTRTRRRSGSRTTASSSASSAARSTAPPSPARRSRSSTRSTASRPRSRPARRRSTPGAEPTTTRPVDETKQAATYEEALELAFCQPTVAGFFVFHAQDETALASWQSGVLYADGTPKASHPLVRDSLERARTGSIARCPGLELPVTATTLRYPTRVEIRRSGIRVRLRCSLDCVYSVRLRKLPSGSTTRAKRIRARAGRLAIADLGLGRVARGNYYFTVSLLHPVNPASEPTRLQSTPVQLP